MQPLSCRELLGRLKQALAPLYDPREAQSIALLVASQITGHNTSALLADPERHVEVDAEQLGRYTTQLATGYPVQYLLGETEFYGRRFAVSPEVLIPRPETEELVAWICRDDSAARRLLDVGTGSGCIAATLAAELPDAKVCAVDLSEGALAVAAKNCRSLGVEVELRQADALHGLANGFDQPFDLIVSNPPYIPEHDRSSMHINVTDHEPGMALFVPDDDPIRFYRAIAHAGGTLLKAGGRLYFEIYELAAEQISRMLDELGYTQITLRQDINGKPRMICCRKR